MTAMFKQALQILFLPLLFVLLLAVGTKAQAPADVVPGSYIVVLKNWVANPQAVASEHGLSVAHVYSAALRGFSTTVSATQLEKVKNDPRVAFVSEDRIVRTSIVQGKGQKAPAPQPPQTTPTGVSRIGALANPNKGTGIGVAVIDTGIELNHPDLSANIVANKSCILGKKNGNDDNGHGTHVAGTIAALDNTIGVIGVAPQAKLIAVKVLNAAGSGTWSTVICGIDWVTANAAAHNIKVANMSLGGSGTSDNNCGATNNDALHKAICNSTAAGVTYVVAAGNSSSDASGFLPAAYNDTVITVSALADSDGQPGGLGAPTLYGADDTFATFSNFGSVVDLGAPGVDILSTWTGGGYNTISGTSMATPHVAGAAALYLQAHPGSTWAQVKNGLTAAGEILNAGHFDLSGLHPEPVCKAGSL